MSESRTVTARNAGALVAFIIESFRKKEHKIIISTNNPEISALILKSMSLYGVVNGSVRNKIAFNEEFRMKPITEWLDSFMSVTKQQEVNVAAIIPKRFQVGTNLPSGVTRIIVDDAGLFLGDVMVEIEEMKKGYR